jgi:hypothetical protein
VTENGDFFDLKYCKNVEKLKNVEKTEKVKLVLK